MEQKPMSMKSIDLVFVDTETTGTDPHKHELLDVAVVRVSQLWTPGEKPAFTATFEWSAKVRPEHISSADPAALKVNGYNEKEWEGALPLEEALKEFSEKTEGAIMVAHNVAFDAHFLDSQLARLGIPNKMHYHRLDTVSMAYAKLHSTPDVGRYSLLELCKYFGITNDRPHSALADALADFELFKKLMEL